MCVKLARLHSALVGRASSAKWADPKLNDPVAPRGGLVEVTLRDGRTVSHFTRFPPGTKENPLDTEGMNAKARGLMEPILGFKRTEAIIQRVNALEKWATCVSLSTRS